MSERLYPGALLDIRVASERRYAAMGFETMHVLDLPDKVYKPHSHHETWLFGLAGLSRVRVGQDWVDLEHGVEVHIGEGVEHEAIVGPDGAEYIFAYPVDTKPFLYDEE